jgi:hypothetical protein
MSGVPRFLLSQPGWAVEYADEQSDQQGEMRWRSGAAGLASPGGADATPSPSVPPGVRQLGNPRPPSDAEIHWRSGDLRSWLADRGATAARSTTMPILGSVAHVFHNLGPHADLQTVVALWELEGRIFEFRARVVDLAAFTELLDSLRRVEENEWLAALPSDAVKPADQEAAIASMLRGVTVPPGFDPATIKRDRLVKDRYQFGVLVAGTVACTWFQRWSQARRDGDAATVRDAITAMSKAKDWPILREMAENGAYPWVLERYAEAMPSGDWHGRPLEADVNSGLGCPALGVPLSTHAAA